MNVIKRKKIKAAKKIAIVVSHFNHDVTEKLLVGAIEVLTHHIPAENITVVHVPGAVEVPLALKRLAKKGIFDGLIALSAVIYGETDHYEYVCTQVNDGCGRVMLDENIPIGFGVLTVKHREHAMARAGGHKGNAGGEAAEAVLHMLSIFEQI